MRNKNSDKDELEDIQDYYKKNEGNLEGENDTYFPPEESLPAHY